MNKPINQNQFQTSQEARKADGLIWSGDSVATNLKKGFARFTSVVLGCAFMVSSCASAPTSDPVAEAVASGLTHLEASKSVVVNNNPNMAKVFITRDFVTPIIYSAKIGIDGEKVAGLKNGQYFETFLEPGVHTITVNMNKLSLLRENKISISVEAGKSYGWELDSSIGLAVAGVPNLDINAFDPVINSFKITDLKKVESK